MMALVMCPNKVKVFILNLFFGAKIHQSARIGLSYINVETIVMGKGAQIGHFNTIRGLDLLEMGDHAVILKHNKAIAIPRTKLVHFSQEKERHPALILGAHSAIVSNHFLDCNNTISIGAFSTIAGIGTAFFTHAINIRDNKQESAPITIGRYTMIGAQSCILKGAQLPDYSVLAANSTLHKAYTDSHHLYSGVPAVAVKKLDEGSQYFHRETGYVA